MRSINLPKAVRAQSLRQISTEAESRLWLKLKGRRLGGYKFTRQYPLGPYFADFACRQAMLVVEADGSQHFENPRDAERDRDMLALGFAVLRFWNAEIISAIDNVCETILAALEHRLEPFDRFLANAEWLRSPLIRPSATFSP